jgi:glycogen debranching enzyme
MTSSSASAASLRHLLVVDTDAFASFDLEVLDRVAERIGPVRNETVLVLIEGPSPHGRIPEPDYLISDGGERIARLPGEDDLEDWPKPDVSITEAQAVLHLADHLLIQPSETFVIFGPGHAVADFDFAGVVVVGDDADGGTAVDPGDTSALFAALDALTLFRPPGVGMSDMCDEAFERAIESLQRNVTDLGFTAASIPDNPLMAHDANYAAVWARDGIMTGLWTLRLDDEEFTECFARTLRLMAKYQTPAGQIPANVRLATETPDYSGLGGIGSIDSVLWFVIGAVRYAFHTGDRGFAEEFREPVERAMTWLSAHDANNDGLIEIPESSDWMDIFPRSYAVLYDEVLWYQSACDTADLLDALGADGSGWRTHSETIRSRILELFWPTAQHLLELAGSSSGRFATGEAQYLLSQVTPFDYGWRCDVYANLLASLCGLLTEGQNERLFRFLWGIGVNSPFPVTCLYPPILSGADDWKDYFLVNFLNLPDHYHNGGIWPFIGGLWVRYLNSIGRIELAHRELTALAEACRAGMFGEWEFNEWLHGTTGRPMGKAHQAWSAASYVDAYISMRRGGEPHAFGPLDAARLQGGGGLEGGGAPT